MAESWLSLLGLAETIHHIPHHTATYPTISNLSTLEASTVTDVAVKAYGLKGLQFCDAPNG